MPFFTRASAFLLVTSFHLVGCVESKDDAPSGRGEGGANGQRDEPGATGQGGSGADTGDGQTKGDDGKQDPDEETPSELDDLADLPDEWVDLDCGSRDVDEARVVSGRIDQNERWEGLIYLSEDVQVSEGAHLEIAPGTKVIVAPEQHLLADDFSTLSARGTKKAPIRFCGEEDEEGSWEGIRVQGDPEAYEYDEDFDIDPLKDLGVALEYVLIENAGGGRFAPFESQRLALVRGVQVGPTPANAMNVTSFAKGSEGLVIGETGRAAIVLEHTDALEELPGNIDFRDEEYGYVVLSEMEHEGGPIQIEKRDFDYYFMDDTSFGTLLVEAGVRFVAAHAYLELDVTELQALGTEREPIVFAGAHRAGDAFFLHAGPGSVLRHVEVESEVFLAAEGSTLDHVSTWTLNLEEGDDSSSEKRQGLTADSQGIVASHILVDSPSIWLSLPSDTKTVDEGTVQLTFETIEQSGTVPALSAPYATNGHLVVDDGAHLTLEPGVEIQFTRDRGFSVQEGARLTALGTPEAPIRLTHSAGAPCSEHWDGLIVRDTAGEVELSHVEVHMATPSMNLYRPIQLRDSLLSGSCGDGLVHAADDDTNYAPSNAFENVVGENIVSR